MIQLGWVLFGALYTLMFAYSLAPQRALRLRPRLPWFALLGIGATLASVIALLLLSIGIGHSLVGVFWTCIVFALVRPRPPWRPQLSIGLSRWALLIFVPYVVLYAVHALAPEIQPDAITYHLGLPAEYLRTGHITTRAGFYEVLPQGMEMLFAFAMSAGALSSAKLVHFALLLATVPLIIETGSLLGIKRAPASAAALLYFCAPVVGVSGTSAYNDAALAFFTLLTVYLALRWKAQRDRVILPVGAGLCAGFCFAIKLTGFPALLILAWLLLRNRASKRHLQLAAVCAVCMFAPWMIRTALITGSPVAPLASTIFPSPYFHAETEKTISQAVGLHWADLNPVDYLWRGRSHQGTLGAAFLFSPLVLLSLRERRGRFLLLCALAATVPWFVNTGTRFLMPGLPFICLALASVMPARWLWLAVAIQAVFSFPGVTAHWEASENWRLRGFPWRAALRLESEDAYLRSAQSEYDVARQIEKATPATARLFSLQGVAKAYLARETLVHWQSAEAENLTDALRAALPDAATHRVRISAHWPVVQLHGLRLTVKRTGHDPLRLFEARLLTPDAVLFISPSWVFNSRPYPQDAFLAMDDNAATAWSTRSPLRREDFWEVRLTDPQRIASAEWIAQGMPSLPVLTIDGLGPDGRWHMLSDAPSIVDMPGGNYRFAATRAIRRAGYGYIIAGCGDRDGVGMVGDALCQAPGDWGLERVLQAGRTALLRIR